MIYKIAIHKDTYLLLKIFLIVSENGYLQNLILNKNEMIDYYVNVCNIYAVM